MPAVGRARTRGKRQRGQAAAHVLAAVLRRVRPPQERPRLRRAGEPGVSRAPGEQGMAQRSKLGALSTARHFQKSRRAT